MTRISYGNYVWGILSAEDDPALPWQNTILGEELFRNYYVEMNADHHYANFYPSDIAALVHLFKNAFPFINMI